MLHDFKCEKLLITIYCEKKIITGQCPIQVFLKDLTAVTSNAGHY